MIFIVTTHFKRLNNSENKSVNSSHGSVLFSSYAGYILLYFSAVSRCKNNRIKQFRYKRDNTWEATRVKYSGEVTSLCIKLFLVLPLPPMKICLITNRFYIFRDCRSSHTNKTILVIPNTIVNIPE